MPEIDKESRRRFLQLSGAAAVFGIAGCMGNGGNGNGGNGGNGNGGNGGTDLSGPVPESERTATSIGGTQRNPDSLQAKNAVAYQSQPSNNQRCDGCTYWIPDESGDGLGACAVVEGKIEPQGWCNLFSPYQQ